jgi:hypothetical protein
MTSTVNALNTPNKIGRENSYNDFSKGGVDFITTGLNPAQISSPHQIRFGDRGVSYPIRQLSNSSVR